MSRNLAPVLIGRLGSLVVTRSVRARTHAAGGIGRSGNSAISGVPWARRILARSATPGGIATRRGSRRLVKPKTRSLGIMPGGHPWIFLQLNRCATLNSWRTTPRG